MEMKKRVLAVPSVAKLVDRVVYDMRHTKEVIPNRFEAAIKFLEDTKHESALPILERARQRDLARSDYPRQIGELCQKIREGLDLDN